MKSQCIFLAWVLWWCLPAYVTGQTLPWPRDPHGVEYRLDSSYGPRYLGFDANGEPVNGTFFHKGIDLNGRNLSDANGDKNYPIYAATYGDIFGIGRASNGLKWIGIDYGSGRTFSYLHIFSGEEADSKGNLAGISPDAEIKSYKRFYTDPKDFANEGIILFYSGLGNTGRIVKALGIKNIHVQPIQAAAVCTSQVTQNCDNQIFSAGTPTDSSDTEVVSAGDGILETIPQGDDKYSQNGLSIVAGINKQCDTEAGYVVVQTSVVPNEVIAPLGISGYQTAAHLHLQINSADTTLNNGRDPNGLVPTLYNDGWDNIIQYLAHGNSAFSGEVSLASNLIYHTADHTSERVTAKIRQRPLNANFQTYHNYELDRVRIFAIPQDAAAGAVDFPSLISNNTHLINKDRGVTLTGPVAFPNPADLFRAEFNYGGMVDASPVAEDNSFPPFLSNPKTYPKSENGRTGLIAEGSLEYNHFTDFVFNQWNTRINKDFTGLAYRSQDAAYYDGEYSLLAVAESVDRDPNEMFVSTPVAVGIDNFRPYLEDVKLFDENNNSQLVRQSSWVLAGNMLVASNPLKSYLIPGEYDLVATFSEKMEKDYVYLGLQGGEGIDKNVFYSTETHKSKAEGRLSISRADFPQDAVTYVVVGGADIAGKALLKVSPGTKTIDPAKLLTRDAAGDMQGEGGYDTSTELRIEVSSPTIAWNNGRSINYSCNGACGTETEPINLAYNSTKFTYADLGAGLTRVVYYKADGAVLYSSDTLRPDAYDFSLTPSLPDGKYKQIVTDNSGTV